MSRLRSAFGDVLADVVGDGRGQRCRRKTGEPGLEGRTPQRHVAPRALLAGLCDTRLAQHLEVMAESGTWPPGRRADPSEMLPPGHLGRDEAAGTIRDTGSALPDEGEPGRDTEAIGVYRAFDRWPSRGGGRLHR